MAETVAVTLSVSAYTALSSSETAVGCFVPAGQSIRLIVGGALPDASAAGFVRVWCEPGRSFEFVNFAAFGVGSGDEVYALSELAAFSLPILRGTGSVGTVSITPNPLPVSLPTGAYSASATFTPAAASHVTPDVNGGAQTFTAMGAASGRIMITSASLQINGTAAEATAWRLHLYNVTPPSALADDTTHDVPAGDQASYLGYIDLGTAIDLGSTQWVAVDGLNKQLLLAASGNLFGYLVNLTTLTPAAVAHIVILHSVAL